jgi:sarcosine oxidase
VTDADVLVVGVGTMGSMALWRLARRGAVVLGLERFEPGHDRGSGHGESRMIRSAYFEGPEYVPLVRSSFRLWRELESETAERLLTPTGALMIGRPGSALVAGALRSARAHGLAHGVLTPGAARARFPPHRLEPDEVALWEAEAGVLRPEPAIRAAAERARALGAGLVTGVRVTAVEADRGGVTVRAGGRAWRAGRAVVSAGPWLGGLLPALGLPLTVERQVMTWFEASEPERFAPDRFPVFIHERAGVYGYGLPSLDGRTVKVAVHHQGRPVDPDHPAPRVTGADVAPAVRVATEMLEGLRAEPVRAQVCLYTNTPDDHFVVGPAPGLPGVTLLSACSGHGFKFAPVMGEIAADMALDGRTDHLVAGFSPLRLLRR